VFNNVPIVVFNNVGVIELVPADVVVVAEVTVPFNDELVILVGDVVADADETKKDHLLMI
jgi:hypothetical protein